MPEAGDRSAHGRPGRPIGNHRAGEQDDQPSRQSGARATARATRNVVEIPGVAGWLKAMARQLQPKRKLVRDEFAQEHSACLLPAPHARGVGLGEPVGKQRGTARGADTPRAVDVFVCHRDAQEWARIVSAIFTGSPWPPTCM